MLHPGLYEQIINTALNNELAEISAARRRIPISARLAALSTRGSCPMNITWRLDREIPAKFLKKTNKLVVG